MRWSGLRALVNSRIASITIAIPVIGFFLIFNDNALRYISLAREFLVDTNQNPDSAKNITLNNLYYTYFGLTSFALGALIFRLSCPRQIKDFPDEDAFFEKQMTFPATARLSSSLEFVIDRYSESKFGRLSSRPSSKHLVSSIEKQLIDSGAIDRETHESLLSTNIQNSHQIVKQWTPYIVNEYKLKSSPESQNLYFNFALKLYSLEYIILDQSKKSIRYLSSSLAVGGLVCASMPGIFTFLKIAKRAYSITLS